jgi:predicted DNA-binding protein
MNDELIKARVPQWIKERITELAQKRGEKESVIVREALRRYLEHADPETLPQPTARRKTPSAR